MSIPLADRLVSDYLERLNAALADVPPDRRNEIVGEIRSHIEEQRAALHDETDADVYNLLERVGEPSELATAARSESRSPAEPRRERGRAGAVEILALVLTPLIWPVGVILLWSSSAWSTRDKMIATLVPPGGYLGLFVGFSILSVAALGATTSCGGTVDSQGNAVIQSCNSNGLSGWALGLSEISLVLVTLALFLSPVLVGIYMARRLGRQET